MYKMKRTYIRENIFKILFRVEFHDMEELEQQIDFYFEGLEQEVSLTDKKYIKDKTMAIAAKAEEIDAVIDQYSEGWPASRLGKAELAIMRLAVYEIKDDEDIPVNVAINEAVELAKKYGADNAPSFINGVLAKIIE